MKRWAALTVLLYALALLALTMPVVLVAFGGWDKHGQSLTVKDAAKFYLAWGYWLWLAVLIAGQALLLLLPINLAERRLPARRSLKLPVIVSAFFLANLCFAGLTSILCAAFAEDGFLASAFLSPFLSNPQNPDSLDMFVGMIVTVTAFWGIWAIIFHRFARTNDPASVLKRTTRWLLRGSILELLVAVPSHIIVRRRGDCCAPIGTFWGIVTGLSLMLLCFGPGVFFVFAERFQRLQPKSPDAGDRTAPE